MNGEIVKLLALLLTAACVAVFLKNYRPEYAMLFAAACAAAILFYIFKQVVPVAEDFKNIIEKSSIPSSAFSVPIKALGIAYLTGLTADTCRDFGQSALAAKAELAGRCAIFALTVPMLESILETALRFAEK